MRFRRIKQRTFVAGIIVGLALVFTLLVPASRAAEPVLPAAPVCTWKSGGELDAVPYAMKGYYASAFAGKDGNRLRLVVTRSDIPSFMVTNGFKDKRSDAYALLAGHFFGSRRQQMQGPWLGAGGEYWRTRIRTDASPAVVHYDNAMLTVGGGYVIPLSRHVYVNPWAAGHLVVAGDRNIPVSGETYVQPRFTAEASIKLGIIF